MCIYNNFSKIVTSYRKLKNNNVKNDKYCKIFSERRCFFYKYPSLQFSIHSILRMKLKKVPERCPCYNAHSQSC